MQAIYTVFKIRLFWSHDTQKKGSFTSVAIGAIVCTEVFVSSWWHGLCRPLKRSIFSIGRFNTNQERQQRSACGIEPEKTKRREENDIECLPLYLITDCLFHTSAGLDCWRWNIIELSCRIISAPPLRLLLPPVDCLAKHTRHIHSGPWIIQRSCAFLKG